MEKTETDYWFNVGGITALLMMFTLMLPLMVLAEWTRAFVLPIEKTLYGVVPMLIYLFTYYFNIKRLMNICRKYAIAEMKERA